MFSEKLCVLCDKIERHSIMHKIAHAINYSPLLHVHWAPHLWCVCVHLTRARTHHIFASEWKRGKSCRSKIERRLCCYWWAKQVDGDVEKNKHTFTFYCHACLENVIKYPITLAQARAQTQNLLVASLQSEACALVNKCLIYTPSHARCSYMHFATSPPLLAPSPL